MGSGQNIKDIWTGYDPKDDKDNKVYLANQKATNIIIASELTEQSKSIKALESDVKKIKIKMNTAESGVKAGWGVAKYIAVFIAEAIALAPIIWGAIRLAVR